MQKISDIRSVLYKGLRLYISVDSIDSVDIMRSSLKAVGINELAVSIPLKDNCYCPLRVGTGIEVYFYHGSGRYHFKSIITGRVIYENKPVLKCAVPKEMLRTERRHYYRVELFLPVSIKVNYSAVGILPEDTSYSVRCVDISGGGLQLDPAFTFKIPLYLGGVIFVDFCGALPGLHSVEGIVARQPRGKRNGWGISFSSLPESDRDRIIKYVFQKQSEKKL